MKEERVDGKEDRRTGENWLRKGNRRMTDRADGIKKEGKEKMKEERRQ